MRIRRKYILKCVSQGEPITAKHSVYCLCESLGTLSRKQSCKQNKLETNSEDGGLLQLT